MLGGAGYAGVKLVRAGELSGLSLLVFFAGVTLLVTAKAAETTARWRPVVVSLLLACLAQYQYFYRDYFGDYGARSAEWFGNNIRGGIERVLALDRQTSAPVVYLSSDIRHAMSYWRFYLTMQDREDLLHRATLFEPSSLEVDRMPEHSLLLAGAHESAVTELATRGGLRLVATATDPNDWYSPLGTRRAPDLPRVSQGRIARRVAPTLTAMPARWTMLFNF